MNSQAVHLFNKSLWQTGADEFSKFLCRRALRSRAVLNHIEPASTTSTKRNIRTIHSGRPSSVNPMLNGVSMLQWFFDEVRPDQREVRYWMKYFTKVVDQHKPFAIMQLCEDVFIQEEKDQTAKEAGQLKRTILETLALSLYFLQQNKMGFVILVGTNRLQASDDKTVRLAIHKNIMKLVDRLEECGARSHPVFDGGHTFNTDDKNRITSLNTHNLDWLCANGNIPVIGCIGETTCGRLCSVTLDEGTRYLSAYAQPLKVLLINAKGGILDDHQQRLTTVFLPKESELKKFVDQPWWNEDTRQRFERACELLKLLPKQSSYVITSAYDLLTELLTQRGGGTMFKKVMPVTKYHSLNERVPNGDRCGTPLRDVLSQLMETAFDKQLNTNYWDKLHDHLDAIYLTEDLKSCAIVLQLPTTPGVAYLDKFAVAKEERGNFNVEVLWQQLKHDYHSLFWRSRHNNVFNTWYESRSDGVVKLGHWHLFWYGVASEDMSTLCSVVVSMPSTFVDDGSRGKNAARLAAQ